MDKEEKGKTKFSGPHQNGMFNVRSINNTPIARDNNPFPWKNVWRTNHGN